MSRLHVKYNEEIAPALMTKFQYKSVMQIPKLSKVIVNVGCGESKGNAKEIEAICKDIATITGQKPITTKARKSVQRGSAPCPRLPRHQPQLLRRPRQLCLWSEGTADLP